ncbi:MAG: glycosyltransferase family 2 protein [Cupriavidus necator]
MSNNEARLLSLVVPCYNDGAAMPAFFARVLPILELLPAMQCEIVCVNDGSSDDTLAKLVDAARCDARIRVLDLTRSFGREAALTAGIDEAIGDAVIPIDVGLQDPPELIPTLVHRWRQGAEVVLAQCEGGGNGSVLKRLGRIARYRLQDYVSAQKSPRSVGEFRLLDRAVVNALKQLPERHRFMKGLFAWVGFNTVTVQYEQPFGNAGRTGRPDWGPRVRALEGVAGFSAVPLRSWTYLGICSAVLAGCYGIYIVASNIVSGVDVPGYAPVLTLMLFVGGLQLIGLGIMGEYVARIYDEAKGRPIYLVKRRYQARRPQERAEREARVISLVASKQN